jgi:hypothetical protein
VPGGNAEAKAGMSPARIDELIGSMLPPKSISVMVWFNNPQVVITPRSWLKAEAEITRPRP